MTTPDAPKARLLLRDVFTIHTTLVEEVIDLTELKEKEILPYLKEMLAYIEHLPLEIVSGLWSDMDRFEPKFMVIEVQEAYDNVLSRLRDLLEEKTGAIREIQ